MRVSISIAVAASFFALSLAGCKPGGKATSDSERERSSQPTAVQRTPEQVQPRDAKVAEFQAGMKKFIEEARSVTRTMDLSPDRASYNKRVESVQEAYSRIPDPPPGNESLAMCYKAARQITVNFKKGDLFLKINSVEGFRATRNGQRADVDELERAVNEARIPKIELSDVIKREK
jgi:hypothetical protein